MAKRRRKTQDRAEEIRAAIPVDLAADFEGSKAEFYLHQFFGRIRENWRLALLVFSGSIVLLIGFSFYAYKKNAKAHASLLAFEKLMKDPVMSSGALSHDRSIKKLNAYIQKFGSVKEARIRAEIRRIALFQEAKKDLQAAKIAATLSDEAEYPELRAFFSLKAAIFFENAGKWSDALVFYKKTVDLIKSENYLRAFALFGQGRALVKTGKIDAGRQMIAKMMEMKDAKGISELRWRATAFLLASGR